MSVNDGSIEDSKQTVALNDNDMYIHTHELRHIVHAAAAYIENGMLDDAEDILQEAIEAGTHDSDIEHLMDQIRDIRGQTTSAGVQSPQEQAQTASSPLVNFTRPLPRIDRLPRPVQRLVVDAENDYLKGKLAAALDSSMVAVAAAPDYLPGYVRVAELHVANGNTAAAWEFVKLLTLCQENGFEIEESLLRGIQVSLQPANVDALLEHARYLLDQRGAVALEPFVPAAIQTTLTSNPSVARDLAKDYVALRPSDNEAVRVYLRSAVTSGDRLSISEAFNNHVDSSTASPDLLYLRAAAMADVADESWLTWLGHAVSALRARPEAYQQVRTALADSQSFVPDTVRHLSATVMALAVEAWDLAKPELDHWRILTSNESPNPAEAFIAAYSASELEDQYTPTDFLAAIQETVEFALQSEGLEFINSTQIFASDITLGSLLKDYVVACNLHEESKHGIEALQRLCQQHPEIQELSMSLADLLIDSGRVNEGIRELRRIAREHEQAGNLEAMVEAMRRISTAVPKNIEIKAMLIDIYTKRGILDEALRELEMLAELHQQRGQIDQALKAYTRAAEIACAIGNFSRGNDLYDRGVAADPNNVPVRHAAVAFCLQTGAVSRAADHLREVVRITLDDNDLDEAVAALHQIIGLAPEDANAYHRLGEVLTSMGEYAQAERVYRRLAEFAPGDPVLAAKQSALAVLSATQ